MCYITNEIKGLRRYFPGPFFKKSIKTGRIHGIRCLRTKLNIFVRGKLIDAEKSDEIIVDILYWIKYNMDKYKTRNAHLSSISCGSCISYRSCRLCILYI